MNKNYIYIGIALVIIVIIVASILIFKPEFSTISGSDQGRIVSITSGGDIILSDNTVKNINDYIDKMQTDITTNITKSINDTKTILGGNITSAVAAASKASAASAASLYQPKGDYLRNKDKVAFGSMVSNAECGGDCRAVTDMWNPKMKAGWQWNEPGSVYYSHASDGKIYIIRAG